MTLTRAALGNPVAALVAVLLAILFGLLSLGRLPIQLTPEVERPEITISTNWRAAAPQEVEAEIIEPQEKVLRGLPGMVELLSRAERGRGRVTVSFAVGTDLQRALLEVLNRLNRVARYPDDADEPVLSTVGGRASAIAWFIIKPGPGNDRPISSYHDFVEEVVQTRFERVKGVSQSEVRGGRERELRVTFDPYEMASLGVQLPEVARVVGNNEDVSAGSVDVGKRRYTVRFTGQFDTDALGDLIIDWREGKTIRLRDVANIDVAPVDRTSFVITKGTAAIATNAYRESGVNVLEVMDGLKAAVVELREGPLKRANLTIEQVYDETIYIDRSILMLSNNLALGVILAVGVLWWFLRRFRATLMVAMAIPVSLLLTFVVLDVAGRTLNVISLAGMAFAVGMVLDAGIVVLENIVRLRERGVSAMDASLQGAGQVWGALLASALTTVAIFLPVVFLKDEAGQLFADLAIAISAAVVASLLVAVSIIPAAANQWMRRLQMEDRHDPWWQRITQGVMHLTETPVRRWLWIGGIIVVSLLLTNTLQPEQDYLPEGNRNLVFARLNLPPGVNLDTIEREMGQVVAERMQPYVTGEKQPQVAHYFFVVFRSGAFMGARATDPARVGELVDVVNQAVRGFPDTLGFAGRRSLFGSSGSDVVEVNLQSRDIDSLLDAARLGFGLIQDEIPGARVRPLPGLELGEPELRLMPVDRRIAEAGWNRETVAQVARALGDGLFVGEYFDGEERLDIIVRAEEWVSPEALAALPVATPEAGVMPFSELVEVRRTAGPDQLRRLDRRRTVTLEVSAPEGLPLETMLRTLQEKVEPSLYERLPEDGAIVYSGSAEKLGTALASLGQSFLLAVMILYLLMSALFRSFIDSLLVLLALPLATVGGVIGLHFANLAMGQTMDLLTMVGFIILLGLVVNNAILLVHQTRAAEREGLDRRSAVEQAVRIRLRPILMSTLTSLFGMLPLLLMPGAGTELYRGLAAVIVGGLSVSTVFTLILLPSLLRLGEGRQTEGSPAQA